MVFDTHLYLKIQLSLGSSGGKKSSYGMIKNKEGKLVRIITIEVLLSISSSNKMLIHYLHLKNCLQLLS